VSSVGVAAQMVKKTYVKSDKSGSVNSGVSAENLLSTTSAGFGDETCSDIVSFSAGSDSDFLLTACLK
jgi:hypothetical protein